MKMLRESAELQTHAQVKSKVEAVLKDGCGGLCSMHEEAHVSGEKQRTTLDLDLALVREAGEVLQSEGITDTVHAALSAVVKQHKMEQLLEYDFPGLTLESLEQTRRLRGG